MLSSNLGRLLLRRVALGWALPVIVTFAGTAVVQQAAAQSSPPAPPTLTAAASSEDTVSFQYSTSLGATSYHAAYRKSTDSTYTVATMTYDPYTIGVGANGDTVTVYVYANACNAAGCSDWAGYLTLQT